MSSQEPCETCGGKVRLERIRDDSLAGADEVQHQRRCTNPSCDTNTGEASAGDRV